jgi:hypothetical protein
MVTPPKTVSARISPPAFAAPLLKRQQKVDYATMHRRLLHCSHEKLTAVAKELGTLTLQVSTRTSIARACHASKEKMKVNREKLVPVQFPLHEDTIHHSKLGAHNFRYSTHMLDACSFTKGLSKDKHRGFVRQLNSPYQWIWGSGRMVVGRRRRISRLNCRL